MRHRCIFLPLLLVALLFTAFYSAHAQMLLPQTPDTKGWFEFPQRGIDITNTVISAASLLVDTPGEDPATVIDKRGFIKVDANGHFVFSNTGKRVRFWGTGLGGLGAFPPSPSSPPRQGELSPPQSAEQLAQRLAKLGFNAVRLHIDNPAWSGMDGTGTIWQDAKTNTLTISPTQIDRLDHLIYQLKRQGIYVNLNLFVNRTFRPNDGVIDADVSDDWQAVSSKNASLFDPVMIALQKEYAAMLLNHVNPYTKLAYKNDPVIFTTESNNENSLFMGFASDELNPNPADKKSLSQYYSKELDGWSPLAKEYFSNRLNNPGFESGLVGWYSYLNPAAEASFDVVSDAGIGSNVLRVSINRPSDSGEAWHVQLGYDRVSLQKGKTYQLSFALRANLSTTVNSLVMRNSDPYNDLGWSETIPVGTEWNTKTVTFTAAETSDMGARLNFDMGTAPMGTQIFLDNISFVELNDFVGWHGWLYKKYGTTAAIDYAWRNTEGEMLVNPSFESNFSNWYLYTATAEARAVSDTSIVKQGAKSLRIEIAKPGTTNGNISINSDGFRVTQGQRYHLSFSARASLPGNIYYWVTQNYSPYNEIAPYTTASLTTEWQTFTLPFTATQSDPNGRVSFELGLQARNIWIDKVSLMPILETEILPNPSFENNSDGWSPYPEKGAAILNSDATTATEGTKSLRIDIITATGSVGVNSNDLRVLQGQRYQLSFSAKASAASNINYWVMQNYSPYEGFSQYTNASLTSEWNSFTLTFIAMRDDDHGRISFELDGQAGSVWIDNVSLKPIAAQGLLAGESLEANSIQRMLRSQTAPSSAQRIQDLVSFYSETESNFFSEMNRYVKSISPKMLNTGTANYLDGITSARSMALTDFVDNHYYWDHPELPAGRSWTEGGWTIKNEAWVNHPFAGLFDKALTAVKGKPFTITEFNAATPNQYEAEGPLLMATFANFQDWDGIFMYHYLSDENSYNGEVVKPGGFLDQVGNPIDLGLMPVAARIFYLQQNDPAPNESLLSFSHSQMAESVLVGHGGSTATYLTQRYGITPAAAFGSRLRVATTNAAHPSTISLPAPMGANSVSNGEQLVWDGSTSKHNHYLVNAPNLQSFIGFGMTKTVLLNNFQMVFGGVPTGATRNADFAAISLQPTGSGSIASASKLLLGVFTRFENTGYLWNANHTSINTNWGTAPALIEPIRFTATVKLNNPAGAVVRILDSTGAPIGTVATQPITGGIQFVVDTGKDKTMWYLIETGGTSLPPTPTPMPLDGTATIKGKVMDDNGTALSDIQVTAYQPQGANWIVFATVTTTADGTYLVPNLSVGSYRLRFQDPFARYITEYYNNKQKLNRATTIKLVANQTLIEINAGLTPSKPVASILYNPEVSNGSTISLTGQLIDSETGQSIGTARVALYHLPGWRAANSADDSGERVCQSTLSLPAGSSFNQQPPAATGDWAATDKQIDGTRSEIIVPNSNPLLSDKNGYFTWQVSNGCWFVEVFADGYEKATSPMIGSSVAVNDLTIVMTPTKPTHTLFLPTISR